ncbi:MAG: hypothetical protein GX444_21570 [Myxococcales bacterium]|nr:hypothetical protein [Myxococcales bacterium]
MKRHACLIFLSLVLLVFVGCNTASTSGGSTAFSDQDGVAAGDDDGPGAPAGATAGDRDDDSNDGGHGDRDCEPVAPPVWPEPDIEDPAVVSFDEDLFFTIDGQRFFPLGFYGVPQDPDSLAQYKSEGFNLALTGPGCCGGGTGPQVDFLRTAQEQGVFIVTHPWSDPNDVLNRPEEELAAELADRTAIGSLFGWYTFDEPALWRPSKELTSRMHEVLTTYSPTNPDGLVEQTMDDFNLYEDDCSFFMIDPYPVPKMFITNVKDGMKEAIEATEGEKPIVGVTQAFSWDWIYGNYDQPFRPTGLEVRNMTWQFIIMGARGLIPFIYATDYSIHAVPEIWEAYLDVIAEINELMSVVLADDAAIDLAAETTFPTTFDYLVKQNETATWVFSVSTNDHSLYVTFDLNAIGDDLCVVDYTTGEIFTPGGDGKVTVPYARLQVRLLEVREN